MFRCITDLKALIIDLDSFPDIDIYKWNILYDNFKCLFIVSEKEESEQIKKNYPKSIVYIMERYIKLFAPSQSSHFKMLKLLGVNVTETVYISTDIAFLNNAMNFLSGTVWVTNFINYEEASNAPDLICRNFDSMVRLLTGNAKGFFGETTIYPEKNIKGVIIPVEFETSNNTVPLYMLGRYFGHFHYMNQLHPYSTAISLNKKSGKPYYGKFDCIFSKLYIAAVKGIQNIISIDGIVSVPTRPGNTDRFEKIRNEISLQCGIKNLGDNFQCTKNYPTQKSQSSFERQDNVKDVFSYEGDLSDKNIVIIDDIITTGATMRECIRELNKHGTSQIFIITLAINQKQATYWSTNPAQVLCPKCGQKMRLLINSHSGAFFYSCYTCNHTLNFEDARILLSTSVNSELL